MSADYFASGIGFSDMKRLLESPAKYRHRADNPSVDTPAMLLGTLVHALVLDQPVDGYTVKDWDGRTTAGKARASEVAELGLTIVDADTWGQAHAIANAVRVKAGGLFTGGAAEVEGHRELDGVKVRAKADYLLPDRIVDLKTTRNADPRLFARDAIQYGYQIQAANYMATFDRPRFVLVAVEKYAPYLVSVHEFDSEAVAWGHELINQALAIYRRCTDADDWPDFLNNETQYIGRPLWAYDDEIEIPA